MIYSTDLLYKPTPQLHFADDGPVKTTMQEVHVNPEEVKHLDHLQGGPQFTSTGKRSYKPLGHLFKNPHIVASYHEHVAEHRANGGAIGRHEHASAANGRYGDTEVVEFPHHLVDIMNKAQGGATYNPWDGKPEYFLGGLFSSFASKLGPMLGKVAKGASNLISRGASATGRAASNIAKRLPSMSTVAGAAGRGLGHVAHAAGAILPAYMQHRNMQQQERMMQPPEAPQEAPEPPKYESLPDDLYGGMAPSRQLSAAKQVTESIPHQGNARYPEFGMSTFGNRS